MFTICTDCEAIVTPSEPSTCEVCTAKAAA